MLGLISVLRRAALGVLVLGGAMTLGASPATAGDPPKLPSAKAPAPTTTTVKAKPKLQLDLSTINPLSKLEIAKKVSVLGLEILPQDLREPVDLTPRRPWADAKTFLRFRGELSPGEATPRIAVRTGYYSGATFHGGYLRLHFAAAPNTAYIADCRVTGGMLFTAALGGPGGHQTSSTAPDGHFVFVFPPAAEARDAFAHIYSNNHWDTSGCTITPAG